MIALHGRARALVGCVMGLLLVGCSDDEHGGTAAAAGEAASAGQAGDEAPSAGDGGADSSQGGSASNGGALGPGLGGDTSDAGDGNLVEVFCGNGLVDGDDECERLEGCKADQKCTASCSCEAVATPPPSSQRLIEAALRAGDIDYATSLKLRVWALYQAPELPEAYDGDGSLGEDTYLYFELSRIRGKLPADVEAAIAPYLTRPNDPTSIFSQAPSALSVTSRLPNVAAAEVTPPPVGCALNDVGQPDWRAHETKHFVVWSCGGGVGGTDDYAAGRVLTGALAEQIWGDMTPKLKVPHKDDYAVGPGDQQRTDIYILGLNQCRWRAGFCTPVKGTEMAAAAPATPCGRENGGPLVSSAYMVIGGAHVPSVASGAQFSKLRYILAHEFFHAMSFNINLEAQGGVCASTGPDLPPEEARSWLTEASAEWASFAFYAADETERRSILFEMFQLHRPYGANGLHETLDLLPYQAFLYPLFVQEENANKPDKMLEFWTGSQSARSRVDLDKRLNSQLEFRSHFRDFSLRNFNRDLPGAPFKGAHAAFDEALTFGYPAAFIPEPSITLNAPSNLELPVEIAPLAAQYEHYYLDDAVRSVLIDVSAVPNMEHLSLDVVANLRGSFQLKRVDGPVFEFCRDDGDQNDFSELYLILSNSDFDRGGKINGHYKLETRSFCPGGWTGTIHSRQTLDETTDEVVPAGHATSNRHEHEDQYWTVVGTELYLPPGAPAGFENERLHTVWTGSRSVNNDDTFIEKCGKSYSTTVGVGSGSGKTAFDAFVLSPGNFSLGPNSLGNSFDIDVISTSSDCYGSGGSWPSTETIPEGIAWLISSPDLTHLVEDPEGSGHFVGSNVILHDEQARPGGMQIIDITVDWDLTRKPQR